MKSLFFCLLCMFLSTQTHANAADKVLIVLTSHAQMGNTGKRTGFWLDELTHPYYVLKDRGFDIDIASIQGGPAPIDPRSLEDLDEQAHRFLNDADLMRKVLTSDRLSSVNSHDYAAVLYSGGHGTMWDFPGNADINRLTAEMYERGGVVAAVCHGPAALIDVRLSDGQYLLSGKRVAAFTDEEEAIVKLDSVVPFLLERKLQERGAVPVIAQPWQRQVIVDGRLVTGQNPQSAEGVGEQIAHLLRP